MATTNIEKTKRHPVPTDAKPETSVCAPEFYSSTILDATVETLTPSVINNGEAAYAQHPLADLLGTFTGATWDEIRQEIAQDHQKEDLEASQC